MAHGTLTGWPGTGVKQGLSCWETGSEL